MPLISTRAAASVRAFGFTGGSAPSDYELIATTFGTGSSSSIVFNSVPSTYKHLELRIAARTSRALDLDGLNIRLNNDSGSNYASHRLRGDGSTVYSENGTGTSGWIGFVTGNTAAAGNHGAAIVQVLDYANTNKNKTTQSLSGEHATNFAWLGLFSNVWLSTSAVTSVSVHADSGSNFLSTTRVSLYGIRG